MICHLWDYFFERKGFWDIFFEEKRFGTELVVSGTIFRENRFFGTKIDFSRDYKNNHFHCRAGEEFRARIVWQPFEMLRAHAEYVGGAIVSTDT